MLKDRIQEIFDFTKNESPYKKANKGWINKDIFLDLSPSSDTVKQTNEAAKVILFWSPINSLLSNIFLIIILGSILVFTSVSFARGRFNFDLFNTYATIDIFKVDQNKGLNISVLKDIDATNSTIKKEIEIKHFDESNNINSLDDDLIKEDQKIIDEKIDKQDSLIKESESKENIENLQNQKPKSNFI